MSSRRRLLEIIATSFKWLSQSFVNLYYSLIPTNISGKQVKDKARVKKIYGNSEVENQLIKNGNFSDGTNDWRTPSGTHTTLSVSSGVLTATTPDGANYNPQFLTDGNYLSFVSGHKYLIAFSVRGDTAFDISAYTGEYHNEYRNITLTSTWQNIAYIHTQSGSFANTYFGIWRSSGGEANTSFDVRNVQLIDLTQQFPFDTPTTLTDNRVQAILNRGYLPYNTGTIKSVNMSELGSESYNLLDTNSIVKGKQIDSTGAIQTNASSCYIMINVVDNFDYMLEVANGTTSVMVVYFDENGTFISRSPNQGVQTRTFTTPQNCKIVGLTCWADKDFFDNNACLHRTGTRTGYAPHIQPQTLLFKYQGNGVDTSHDTMEIGKENVVFTKNVAVHRFTGSETIVNLSQYGTNFMGIENFTTPELIPPNEYLPMFNKRVFNKGSISNLPEGYCYTYSRNFYYNIGTNDQQANIEFITGLEMAYQLATPQVIRIPKKRLGVIDLGSLSYVAQGNGRFVSGGLTSTIKPVSDNANIGNIYCSEYLSVSYYNISTDMSICIHTSGNIYIQDNSKSNMSATDFKNAMQGIYLFYETAEDVAEIETKINVEAGGTLNGVWFSWVENQQLLLTGSNSEGILTTIENNCYVIDGTTTTSYKRFNTTSYGIVGHKYLSYAKIVSNDNNISVRIGTLNEANGRSSPITSGEFYSIFTLNSITNFGIDNFTSGTTFANFKAIGMLIDLTVGFPDGDIPTSIDDQRIQEIIRLGYIPTNIQGTPKSIDCEVLPNAEMEIKCK